MFQRQTSMLNNRLVFAGLQVGNSNSASLLSFQRFDPASIANMALRERIMSKLHDELPGLDLFLNKYIQDSRHRALPAHDSLTEPLGTEGAGSPAQALAVGREIFAALVPPSADDEILPYCCAVGNVVYVKVCRVR